MPRPSRRVPTRPRRTQLTPTSETSAADLEAIWSAVRAELSRSLPPSAVASWLDPVEPVGVQGRRLFVSGPVRVRDWFHRRYGEAAESALRRAAPGLTSIEFTDGGDRAATTAGSKPAAAPEPDHDFDGFVIGRGNRFAHSAALAVAELPGDAYNPLFIHGDPGLGKTHLLISIAAYLRRRRADLSVVYTTAERFTSDFVGSVRSGGGEGFKERYRGVGALLIDDIQFLEDKPKTEDEFFHTFNELYAAGSQIVLSSDRPPEAMARLGQRLRDRFAWGLTARVEAPDVGTRMALLSRLAAERGLGSVDRESLAQIAAIVPANLRQLEGALTRVGAHSSLLGEPPTPELVRRALGCDGEAPTPPLAGAEGPAISDIQAATCEVLRVSPAELRSGSRRPALVRARQLAMYVSRKQTDSSLAEIARAFDRDHSTVLYAIRTVDRRLEPGSDLHRALEAVHDRLRISVDER